MERKLSTAFTVLVIGFGIFTLLAWLGSINHMSIVFSADTWKEIAKYCGNVSNTEANEVSGLLCQGWYSFTGGWFTKALGDMLPLGSYAIISLLLFGGFLIWQVLRGSGKTIHWKLRPWQLLLWGMVSLWLITMSLGHHWHDGDILPSNTLVEPIREAYQVSNSMLVSIKNNFTELLGRGCIAKNGQQLRAASNTSIDVYSYSTWCMNKAFISRVVPQIFFILFLIFELLIAGRLLLHLSSVRPRSQLTEFVLSLSLGVGGFASVLWLLAVLHLFSWISGWALLIAIPILGYKHLLYWVRSLHTNIMEWELSLYDLRPILAWLLISYLALNFLSVIRPFPIGWDDLGSYINRPRLLVSYGHFIYAIPNIQWEYLTSLGFLLFGYQSTFAATAAMQINWMAGLFAVLGLIGLGNIVFRGRGGLITASLYYMLPMVGHFSYADMKIDNSLTFIGSVALLCTLKALFFHDKEEDSPAWRWLLLAGFLSGIALGFKITTMILTFALISMILGVYLGWKAALGAIFLSFGAYSLQGILSMSQILERLGWTINLSQFVATGILLLVGGAFLATAWTKSTREKRQRTFTSIGVFLVAFVVAILPWMLHNNFQAGNIIPKPLFSASNRVTPSQDYQSLPEHLALDTSHSTCQSTSKKEELGRYWGDRTGIHHYLTLPWRTVMNIDSSGYYVTTIPMLLLFPLLLLLPFLWKREGLWLRWLTISTLFMVVQWVLLANGVPWYGLVAFIGLCLGLEALWQHAPNNAAKVSTAVLIGISIFLMLGMRFWQLSTQRTNYEYPLGKSSAQLLRDRTVPHYDAIAQAVVENYKSENTAENSTPYLYRVGTFIPYFIPQNLEIIARADAQLDFFNCLNQEAFDIHEQYRSQMSTIEKEIKLLESSDTASALAAKQAELTTLANEYQAALQEPQRKTSERFKHFGFGTIVFDTNTHTIEHKPGTLHNKVRNFIEYVNHPAAGIDLKLNKPDLGIAFMLIQ